MRFSLAKSAMMNTSYGIWFGLGLGSGLELGLGLGPNLNPNPNPNPNLALERLPILGEERTRLRL